MKANSKFSLLLVSASLLVACSNPAEKEINLHGIVGSAASHLVMKQDGGDISFFINGKWIEGLIRVDSLNAETNVQYATVFGANQYEIGRFEGVLNNTGYKGTFQASNGSEFPVCFGDQRPVSENVSTAVNILQPNPRYGRVWNEISGTYSFVDRSWNERITINADAAFFSDSYLDCMYYFTASINDDNYPATVNRETGEIRIINTYGDLVFDGYMYDGGNTIAGKLRGHDIKYLSPCGN